MRTPVDSAKVLRFLEMLGRLVHRDLTVYLTGGGSAVVIGWRSSTLDLDLRFEPDDEVFGLLPRIKEELELNLELASPDLFLPPLEGWRDRSLHIATRGAAVLHHFDFYSQALAKIERGFEQDLTDVEQMAQRSLIERSELLVHAESMRDGLARYPAVDPGTFFAAVRRFVEARSDRGP